MQDATSSDVEKIAAADHDDDVAVGTMEREKLSKAVLWKLDVRLIPVLAILFLCSFLDRTNVGNAKIIGLTQDLGMNDYEYSQGLAVYYATYIFSELPSNLVIKRVTAKVWLPFLTVAWGIITMGLGFVQNKAGFIAVRALLGLFEGGLVPGIILYLASFYTRGELALRIGLFYTAASLSGAFGGLLARGLSAIGPAGGLAGWRWILILEGIITAVVGALCYFALPHSPATAKFLTPEQQEWAARRLDENDGSRFSRKMESSERFSWSEVRRGVFNLQVWLSSTAYFAILSGLYSFGLFLPTIIQEMQIAKNADFVQLWSVIPFAVATPVTVSVAFLSDRLKLRGPMMLSVLPLAIVGYAVIAHVTSPQARFAMTTLMAMGMYASVPPVLVWNANNSAGHYKRATTSALQLAVANAGGFVATFVYPGQDKPYFRRGHTIVLGLLCYAWVATLANVLLCWKINKDKKAGKYAKFEGCGDDRDPEFRMML